MVSSSSLRLFLLKEELRWYNGDNTWLEGIELFVDLGYIGIADDFIIETLQIPMKNQKQSNSQLTDELNNITSLFQALE